LEAPIARVGYGRKRMAAKRNGPFDGLYSMERNFDTTNTKTLV